MNQRRLGRTGLSVSEIGFGAWGIGQGMWVGADDAESTRALHRAFDLGIDFVDTALAYGPGHSEKLVGKAVRERSGGKAITIATKVPPKNLQWPAAPGVPASAAYPKDHVLKSAESSLRNLGQDRIDLLQLHTWRDEFLAEAGWQDALAALKKSGKVRFVGISVNDHDPATALAAVASGIFDTVQVIYNIFDQSPEAELFPACLKHDVGVLARVPFDEGGLTGAVRADTVFPPADFRARYFAGERRGQLVQRVEALEALLGPEASTLPELALRFCLAHDAVSTVIPGMRRVSSVEANAAVGDGRRLSPELRRTLAAHAWPRNFYLP